MNEKYLVINSGSSSLKFALYEMPEEKLIVSGYVEKIGNEDSFYTLTYNNESKKTNYLFKNHLDAVTLMFQELTNKGFVKDLSEIRGVGHRTLFGGEKYTEPTIIDDEVEAYMRSTTRLGPLHINAQLMGIRAVKEYLPHVRQVAIFDTAFHHTIPMENFLYAVPFEWYTESGVRKYGFHGTSHQYITEEMQKELGKEDVNLIICHIGSGASVTCIKDGESYNTSMGFTPLDGLIMGTRSGSIDASIIEYMAEQLSIKYTNEVRQKYTEQNVSKDIIDKINIEVTAKDVTTLLNKKSGLLGLTSKNDLRDVEKLAASGDKNAIIALKMLVNSISNYIVQYGLLLEGRVDGIVFTAGAGENDIQLRKDIINTVSSVMPIKISDELNESIAGFKETKRGEITSVTTSKKVFVIPTNEELMIVRDSYRAIKSLENLLLKRLSYVD